LTSDTQRQTEYYVAAVGVSAVAVCAALLVAGYSLQDGLWTVLILIVVNAIAERGGVWITGTTQLSIALLPTLFAAVLFGPLAAGLVIDAGRPRGAVALNSWALSPSQARELR